MSSSNPKSARADDTVTSVPSHQAPAGSRQGHGQIGTGSTNRGSGPRLICLSLVIALLAAVLYVPLIQHELVYMHHVNWPFGNLSEPISYGLPPGKARNVRLNTADGVGLGAWHILPRSVYKSLGDIPLVKHVDESVYDIALQQRPIILFFHGNAANRAVPYRVRIYTALANQLDCNVLAIDYRGFGDSTGSPTQSGLTLDAHTALEYVRARSAPDDDKGGRGPGVVLAGHSLGTGVIAQLMTDLSNNEQNKAQDTDDTDDISAGVLISPFTSLGDVMMGYWGVRWLLGTRLESFLRSRLGPKFDSLLALQTVTNIPILIAHAQNDWTIPVTHARRLYKSLLSTRRHDPANARAFTLDGWGIVNDSYPALAATASDARSSNERGRGRVVFWEGTRGGHNNLGWTEAGVDLIARIAGLS